MRFWRHSRNGVFGLTSAGSSGILSAGPVHIAEYDTLMAWNPFRVAAVERARREELTVRCARLEATQAWLFVRVNQLEKERAILFREVTHLPIPVPEIVQNAIPTSVRHMAVAVDALADMGDDEAQRQGVDWDPEGAVRYR